MIKQFKGDYFFLSNFYPCKIVYENIEYASVECAYQAAKTLNVEDRVKISKMNSSDAKKFGQTIELRPDWENKKYLVMKELVNFKFGSNLDLQKKLLDTGKQKLIEGNDWNDTYWGVCGGVGDNYLGRLLMDVRSTISDSWDGCTNYDWRDSDSCVDLSLKKCPVCDSQNIEFISNVEYSRKFYMIKCLDCRNAVVKENIDDTIYRWNNCPRSEKIKDHRSKVALLVGSVNKPISSNKLKLIRRLFLQIFGVK
jgi:hypothetical protein